MDFSKHVYPGKPELVNRDDLDKKKSAGSLKVKKKVHFDDGNECKQTSAIQIKILMTKEEAARLLSKSQNGGVLRFQDLPNLSLHIPTNCAHAFSSTKKDK